MSSYFEGSVQLSYLRIVDDSTIRVLMHLICPAQGSVLYTACSDRPRPQFSIKGLDLAPRMRRTQQLPADIIDLLT
jgi:hypothetical protein